MTSAVVATCLALGVVAVAAETSVVAEPAVAQRSWLDADPTDVAPVILANARAAVLQGQRAREAQHARAVARQAAVRRAAATALAKAQAVARSKRVVAAPPKPKPRPTATTAPVTRVAAVARHVESAAERGSRVLSSLGYDWHKLGYRIEFLPGREGYLGTTVPGKKLIQIYVRSNGSDLVLAHSIAHEIGHAVDFSRGNAAKQALYLSIRGLDSSLAWFGCSGCTDYQTPAGDWAEVFAYWLAGPGDFRSLMAGAPDATQLHQLSGLFAA